MRTITRGALLLLAILTMGEFGCSTPLARTSATPQDAATPAGTVPVPCPTIPRTPDAPIPAPSKTGDLGATTTPIDAPMSDEVPKTTVASPCGYQTVIAPEVSHFPPVTDSSGAIAYSHDGLALAFPERAVTVQIHVAQPGLADWGFAWSPDGLRVAFLQSLIGPTDCRIGYLMMAELGQGQVRPLVDESSSFSPPSWSPDGNSLAFVQWTGRGVGSLVVLDTVSRRLITVSNWARDVAWLDDEHVLYARADPTGNPADLVSQRLDGSRPVVVVAGPVLSWVLSADRRHVAYSDADGRIVLIDIVTGRTTTLGRLPGWAPGGSRLAQWSPDGHYVLGTVDEAGLFVVEVGDEERVRELPVAGAIGRGQSVAPDGHSIALVTGVFKPVSGGQKLSLHDVGRNALRELPIMVEPPWDVAWSPR